jgi:hypothetical protein
MNPRRESLNELDDAWPWDGHTRQGNLLDTMLFNRREHSQLLPVMREVSIALSRIFKDDDSVRIEPNYLLEAQMWWSVDVFCYGVNGASRFEGSSVDRVSTDEQGLAHLTR